MAVDHQYPLISLDEALTYIDKDPMRDALWIYCNQGDATAATVEVTDTTIVLIITGGAAPGTETLTFDDSDNNTLSELVTAINALTGWAAGRLYHSDASSTDLLITGALSCLASANEQTLVIKDNYFIERLIDRATDFIERHCNRKLASRTYTREVYYGSGYDRLMLEQYPVTRVMRLSVGRANSFSIKNTSTDANYCTVEVTDTDIRLIVDGGTNEDDTELTLSDYATIDALITAIEALAKGWSCTTLATDTDSRDASELLIRPSMAVTSTAQAHIETVDDDITDYKILSPGEDRNYGAIQKPSGFSPSQEYFFDFVAGYTVIPYALEMTCLEYVKYKYDASKRDTGLKSETMGKVYSYENFSIADFEKWLGLHPTIKNELDLFVRREF